MGWATLRSNLVLFFGSFLSQNHGSPAGHGGCEAGNEHRNGMRILVVALAGIGDCLIATPLIHELRVNHPEAVIDAFVFWPGSKDLLEGNPHLNTVHQKNLLKVGRIQTVKYLWELRKHRYDIVINAHPQGPIHYRIAARIIGAPIRLSHWYECCSPLDHCLVNRVLPQDYSVHSIENNLRMLPLLGKKAQLSAHDFEIFLKPEEQRWAEVFVATSQLAGRRRLGLHVGSGGTKNLALKRWPLANYIELLRQLIKTQPGLVVVLFGGPQEAADHAEIARVLSGGLILAPPTPSLRHAAALMKHCDAFLSVDTALMHVAAAMKVPNQIVIEAPTLNPTNLPWRTRYRVIRNPGINGRNLEYYRYDGGPIRGSREELLRLMASIKVADVLPVVVEALADKHLVNG